MPAGSIVVDLLARTGSFETDIQRSTKAAEKRFREMERTVKEVGSAMGLAFGAAGVAALAFGKNIVDGLDALNDIADATGASIENISALEDVAARTGTKFDTVGAALVKFNATLKDTDGDGKAARALEAIGLNVQELKRLDPAEALLKTAQALDQFADDGEKARLVQELFGKSTKDVAAFLKDLAEQKKLVATVTTEETKAAEAFNKELFAMQKNVTDLGRYFVSDLVTGINASAKAFRESGLIEGFRTLLTGTDRYKAEKEVFELTGQILDAENKLAAAKRTGFLPGMYQTQLDQLNEKLRTAQSLLKVLDMQFTMPAAPKPSVPAIPGSPPPPPRASRPPSSPRVKADKPFATDDRFSEADALAREAEILNEAQQAWAKYADQVEIVPEKFEALNLQLSDTYRLLESAGEVGLRSFGELIRGGRDFDDVMKNLLLSIGDLIFQIGVVEPLMRELRAAMGGPMAPPANPFAGFGGMGGGLDFGSMLGSMGSSFMSGLGSLFGGFFAEGGSPPVGKISVVGENGPELFVPRTSGSIIPTLPDNRAGNGSWTIVNQTTGRIDKATEQRLSSRDRVLILQEAQSLLVGELHNPNSRISQALKRNFTVRTQRQ